VELIPQMILRLARGVPAYASQMGWLAGDPAALLVVEFSGDDANQLRRSVERIANSLTIAESPQDQARVWNVRKVGLGILDSRPQSARPVAFIEDCAIPVERLGEFVREVEKILAAHGAEGGIYAHASAGCLHIRPILNLKSSEGIRSMRQIAEATLALTLSLGGSMSSEHGDGIARGEFLKQTYGEEVIEAMRLLKRAADPHNLLNPNKMFDAPKMDSHLRYGETHSSQAWTPALSFSHRGGLGTSIEQCNGQGVCRKTNGVMCPSYQATREESNSTRGRANLLRSLITQTVVRNTLPLTPNSHLLSSNSILSSSAFSALDLCLACKGCKAECPSGVDMAKLKIEFMNEYYKTHPRKLRDYLFGYFHVTARILSIFAPIVNAMMSVAPIKNLAAKLLQITPHRPFPKFTWKRAKVGRNGIPTHGNAIKIRAGQIANPTCGKVIFLSDAFSRYSEPQVEQAAFNILTACGYEVLVLSVVGAGAGLVSKSLVAPAQRHARRVLDALERLDPARVLPIVGVEPPEIYCLKNDYVDLVPSRADEIASRASRVWLLDEFLLRSDAFRPLRVARMEGSSARQGVMPKIQLQPHCHQRAEAPNADGLPTGATATLSLLQSVGFDVEMIDAGCCGMAGTFGYEAEHYELSMKVGERLFANSKLKIQNLEIVCSGAACRMQVTQGGGVEARHPLEAVWEAVNH
jgi:Fe-S oxidoreductase